MKDTHPRAQVWGGHKHRERERERERERGSERPLSTHTLCLPKSVHHIPGLSPNGKKDTPYNSETLSTPDVKDNRRPELYRKNTLQAVKNV